MLTRSLGWFAILLLLIGIVRSVPMSPDRSVKASTPPAVVTIDPEATAAAEIENKMPVYEWVEPIQSLEDRIEVLEAASSEYRSLIDSMLETQTETVKAIGRIVENQEKLQRALLGQLKQSADEKPLELSKPETAPRIEPQAKLFAFGAEWCQPCKTWKASPDAEKIAADGCEIVPVDADEIEPGKPRPASVPYFELWIGTNFARHSGHLSFEKYKAMEKAVRETVNRPLKSASPSSQKKWRVDEGHVTPSVEGMTIEHHLTEHHGVNIDGMTVAEMEAKHQSIDHSKLNQSKSAYQRSPIASARLRDMPRALGWMRVGK